ncbi:hypothetical protein [Brevibacillus sp. SYSU BS000544]|uniref:hypothetical protein n=1 Tax=Brevibacillus sp. SYSU BS000544 TaxID=3416443 RepID=UPI003CE531FA
MRGNFIVLILIFLLTGCGQQVSSIVEGTKQEPVQKENRIQQLREEAKMAVTGFYDAIARKDYDTAASLISQRDYQLTQGTPEDFVGARKDFDAAHTVEDLQYSIINLGYQDDKHFIADIKVNVSIDGEMKDARENYMVELENGKWKLSSSFGAVNQQSLEIDYKTNGIRFNQFIKEETENGLNYQFMWTNENTDRTILIGSGNAAVVKLITDKNQYSFFLKDSLKPLESKEFYFYYPDVKGNPLEMKITGLLFADAEGNPFPGKASDYFSVTIPMN